jgi:hypothetical protein
MPVVVWATVIDTRAELLLPNVSLAERAMAASLRVGQALISRAATCKYPWTNIAFVAAAR